MRKQAIAAKICRDKFRRLVFALLILAIMFVWAPPIFGGQGSVSLPNPHEVQNVAKRVNDYRSANRPGPEDNDWSRSVYFIGNMAYYQMTGDLGSLDKSWQWAETDSRWQLIGGCQTVFAAYQTAGQTYLALYQIDPQRAKLACLLTSIEHSTSWGWIEVDLGKTTNINRFSLLSAEDRAYRYLVDIKNNPSDPYTMVLDHSDVSLGDSTIAATAARFVRLRVIGAAGYNGKQVSLAEFRIFGKADPVTNLALNRPVTCSGEADTQHPCANTVDGRANTLWSATIPNDITLESPNWWWIDALYVAAPIYATLSQLEKQGALPAKVGYAPVLYAKFDQAKTQNGLFNRAAGLWYRDSRFLTIRSPNGKDIFWSRGNGWVLAALARILDILPVADPHYQEYLTTFQAMAHALLDKQQEAGYWNENLADPQHCGGPESSGTAFFTYALAWGINQGALDRTTYLPATLNAWNWLTTSAVQSNPDGLLGYVQPVGDSPVCDETTPLPGPTTTADFGVGAFLLAASEVHKLPTSVEFDLTVHLPLIAR